jgi:hypothetical protein
MCWSLSPSIVTKETWGYQKNIWTREGPSIKKKGEEKKKERKRKIAMFSKGFTKGER